MSDNRRFREAIRPAQLNFMQRVGYPFLAQRAAENSPALQCWVEGGGDPSPVRDDRSVGAVSVVPDGTFRFSGRKPSTEVLGYFRSSLRDGGSEDPSCQETKMRPPRLPPLRSSHLCGVPQNATHHAAPSEGSEADQNTAEIGRNAEKPSPPPTPFARGVRDASPTGRARLSPARRWGVHTVRRRAGDRRALPSPAPPAPTPAPPSPPRPPRRSRACRDLGI